MKPTVVLVHGAFADSTAWNPVISELAKQGIDAIAVANPLRSLATDAQYVRDVVNGVGGPVVLVGHSYGGMVITEAATGLDPVRALVYVAAFVPDHGESAFSLSGKFPGGTLGEALVTFPLSDGNTELKIDPAKFPSQFGADLELEDAILLGRTQRSVTQKALTDELSADKPAWKTLPTWEVFGDSDRNIPADVFRWQVQRSSPQGVREVAGASHAIATSRPDEVTAVILEAVAFTS
ncbi:alpha/beta fold hydrolase [Paractinoplanes atraurantiacus]|uniref:Pimeloyl-ACP methyl ester carboxylesterase n=1 Tax=Paractinoplanes atraurantiacus TaxID=1036182 RepID=A0A285K889_9ACTN|nr:alpha/beta hydrolase [Actinoplanes atraurantiacus]SNY68810.1 Pimeloyl-ACP methyl ester carboxylesterase [Actinoplanes atraurantiacus]